MVVVDAVVVDGLVAAHAVFVTEPAGGAGRPQAVLTESALEQVAVHVPLEPI